jgi:RNA polymerase sigma-70 factor (ECF subfamily)
VTLPADNPRKPGEERSVARLCCALRAGDEATFTDFYRAWYPRLYGAVRGVFGSREALAHDAVQEAFVRVIRGLPTLETSAALEAWMFKTARSAAIDLLRKEVRRAAREAEKTRGRETAEHPDADELDWLRAALVELDPREVELLRARFMSTRATVPPGATMSPGAAQGRFTRVMHRLRRWAGESMP